MANKMENGNLKALSKLKTAIENSHRIVVLTGAGASVPSGIPDFRSAHGLYATSFGKYPAETVISHDFFMMHPKEFYDFYKSKMVYPDAKPNAMHALLARLERSGKIEGIVTQNIDGLHQAAGSKKVFELHGSIWRNRCERCRKFFDLDYILSKEGVPHCDECGGIIKPEVVLYGENLDEDVLRGAIRADSKGGYAHRRRHFARGISCGGTSGILLRKRHCGDKQIKHVFRFSSGRFAERRLQRSRNVAG